MRKILSIILALMLVVMCLSPAKDVQADSNGLILVDSTAYYDKYKAGHGADGRPLVEGLTIAGKKEWIGMSVVLYDLDKNMIGIYEVRDTGYGQASGYGQSQILKGKTVGTIEAGKCIDIYFDSYAECVQWGRKKVYMQLVKAVG